MSKPAKPSVGPLKVFWLISGIYIFFLAFGLAQEKIYRLRSPTGEKFIYSIFLVMVMCFGNVFVSLSFLVAKSSRKLEENVFTMFPAKIANHIREEAIDLIERVGNQGIYEIAMISLTYVMAMLATNLALTRVNFPTQVLVKSAKMVPVIVGGFLLYRKRYPAHDYLAVLLVTIGLIGFNITGSTDPSKQAEQKLSGILLLCVSLFCDGMTGPRQDKLLSRIEVSSTEFMLLVNVFSCLWTVAASMIVERTAPVKFLLANPSFSHLFVTFCVCAAIGQLFIFECLKSLGSLYLTLITTTRKFVTVIVSVVWFSHSLTLTQWIAVSLVFTTLLTHSIHKHRTKNSKHSAIKPTLQPVVLKSD